MTIPGTKQSEKDWHVRLERGAEIHETLLIT